MAKIYSKNSRLNYKIGDIEVTLAPLNIMDKSTLQEYMIEGAKGDVKKIMQGSAFAIRAALKGIKGVTDEEGNPWELSFDENGYVTEQCADDLLNMSESSQFVSLCAMFLNGVPGDLPDGVKLVKKK